MSVDGQGGDAEGGAPAVKMEQDVAMIDGPQISSSDAPVESSSAHTVPSTAPISMPRHSDTNGTAARKSSTTMPTEAAHHGAPTRDWINTKVTGVLLEGMKQLAAERPDAPLKVLGEYLLKKSAELEGTGGSAGVVNGH